MSELFKYHKDPKKTKTLKQGSEKHICQCCKKLTSVYYDGPFYSITDVSCLCPECIATGGSG